MTHRRHRRGYTLLEILLASAIALILLAALYVTLDVTLLRMDTSRDQITRHELSRSVINRMGTDLSGVLGPMPPKSGGGLPTEATAQPTTPTNQSTTGQSTTPTATPSPGGNSQGSTTPSADPTASTTSTETEPETTEMAVAADVPFQAGLVGTDRQLTIFLSRVPESLTDPELAADPEVLLPGDLRKITYYLGEGGLCRQERPWVTANGVRNSADPDRSTEDRDIIAPEVVDIVFEYFDGGTWQSAWDGSAVGTDGKTVTGPPRAIRATFVLHLPGRGGAIVERRVQHVFPVRAAVGNYLPPTEETTTDPTMTTPTGEM